MHSLDVVAVGIADEDTEVAGVVFGPHPWLVQNFGADADRRVAEPLKASGWRTPRAGSPAHFCASPSALRHCPPTACRRLRAR